MKSEFYPSLIKIVSLDPFQVYIPNWQPLISEDESADNIFALPQEAFQPFQELNAQVKDWFNCQIPTKAKQCSELRFSEIKLNTDRLLCLECHETCGPSKGCDLYLDDPDGTDHVHCAGGDKHYGLCLTCLEKFYQRHRPTDPQGKWRWITFCDNGCGYCNRKDYRDLCQRVKLL